MSKYEVIIYWSDEDDAFVAELPDRSRRLPYIRPTQEALANAAVIIQEWLETARELGRAIPEPKGWLIYA